MMPLALKQRPWRREAVAKIHDEDAATNGALMRVVHRVTLCAMTAPIAAELAFDLLKTARLLPGTIRGDLSFSTALLSAIVGALVGLFWSALSRRSR